MARRIANNARVPAARFNIDSYLHENRERPGSFNISGGYFLNEDLGDFEPAMFDLAPIEAALMDPQQRKLLEVAYEAIENAGCTLDQVASELTGSFAASFTSDFQQMSMKETDFRHVYSTTGIDPGVLANRVSHAFNLRGPT
jgi:acyl transferase domain-containing protein